MPIQPPIISKISKPLPSGIYLGELVVQWRPGSRVCRVAYRRLDGSVYVVAVVPDTGAHKARKLIDSTMRDIIDPLLASQGDLGEVSRLKMIRTAWHLGTALSEPLEPMLDKLEQGRMMQ